MNIVGIKHPNDKTNKMYWFKLPEENVNVSLGELLICDTKNGWSVGQVEKIFYGLSNSEVRSIAKSRPTKKVIGRYIGKPIESIVVPSYCINSFPSPNKLTSRIKEYYNWRNDQSFEMFKTKVLFDRNNVLKDGYTAYLVAKMFDRPILYGCILF